MWFKGKIILLVIVLVLSASIVFAADFPYRKDFPKVSYISSQSLKAKYDTDEVIVVDVRSKIEFDVIHVKKAVHIPMAYMNFVENVEKLIKENPKKTIAFYCNGITCLKSYESAEKMMEAGHKNTVAYDAGIPEWAKLYPADTILMGKVLKDSGRQLIPESEFKKRLISFETFKAKASEPNAAVIDVRDHIQSSGKLPGLENARTMPLDKFIPNFVAQKRELDKTLLIFDQVGKQVEWLMYYLKDNGYENYYFLDKGATKVLQKQDYK